MVNYYFCSVYTNIRYFQISFICKIEEIKIKDLNALKIAFNFLIVAVDESFKLVDAVIVQLNYAVDGLTNDCRKKSVDETFLFLVTLWKLFDKFLEKKFFLAEAFFFDVL